MKRRAFLAAGLGTLGALLAGCQNTSAPAAPTAVTGAQPTRPATGSATPTAAALADPAVKFGVLSIVDVLPMYVAEKNGYYTEQGLKVELVPFVSAVERETAMLAGQIDGSMTDMISTALMNKAGDTARIVRTVLKTNPERFIFSIVVAGNSQIQKPEDLKGKDVAISLNTVIEYWVDERLASLGFKDGEVKKTAIPAIPARLQALTSGQVAAANLPEPFASKAIKDGARLLIDDKGWDLGTTSVVTFTTKAIQNKPETVRRFLAAVDRASKEINANPEKYRALLVEQAKISPDIQETFKIAPYPGNEVPTKAEVDRLMKWAVMRKVLIEPVAYEKLVNGDLIK